MVDLGDNTTKRINFLQLIIMSFVYDCDMNSEEVVVKDNCLSLIREIINYLEVFIDQSGSALAMGDKKRILRIVRKLRTIVSEWRVCCEQGCSIYHFTFSCRVTLLSYSISTDIVITVVILTKLFTF